MGIGVILKTKMVHGGSLVSGIGSTLGGVLSVFLDKENNQPLNLSSVSKTEGASDLKTTTTTAAAENKNQSATAENTTCDWSKKNYDQGCNLTSKRYGYELKIKFKTKETAEKVETEFEKAKGEKNYWQGFKTQKDLAWCFGANKLWKEWRSWLADRCGKMKSGWSFWTSFPDMPNNNDIEVELVKK